MRADCFFRAWSKDPVRKMSDRNVRCVSIEVDEDASLELLLSTAHASGASKGNGQTGIYEIQTDLGIWRRPDGRPLASALTRVVFLTWDELDALEEAA